MSLKKLQKQWYKLLKDSGFNDIENVEADKLNTWHTKRFADKDPNVFQAKLDYYLNAAAFLEHYRFKSHVYKEIWRLHADGVSMRNISIHFSKNEIKINKDKVNSIIKFLREEMKK